MLLFENCVSSDLRAFVNKSTFDPWIETPFEGYVNMSPSQKGQFGEIFVSNFMETLNCNISDRQNTQHDRVIDGYKVEIKFGLAQRDYDKRCVVKDNFTINHVAKDKDWDRLVFFGINPNQEDCKLFFFDKVDFLQEFDTLMQTNIFMHQQTGKKSGNDDYMCPNKCVSRLHKLPWVKDISKWQSE